MKQLLSYRDKRLLKISELLILNSRPVAIEEIMDANRCSLKTVYADIEYLEEAWGSLLEIENFVGSVYSSNTSIADLMKIRQSIYGNTLALRIALNIYFCGKKTIQELSKELHYSESKIRKEISLCNQFLEDLDIQIVSKDAQFMIEAKDQESLAYLASLAVLSSGYPEEIYANRKTLIEQSDFEKKVGMSIPSVIRDEILLADYFYQMKNSNESALCYYPTLPDKMMADVERLVRKHAENAEAILEIVEPIFRALYYKASIFKNKHIFFMNRYRYFYYLFRLENKYFLEHFEDNLLALEKKWGLSLTVFKEELLFLMYINIPDIRYYRQCKIGVYSDLGEEHAHILKTRLEKSFLQHQFSVFDEASAYHLVLSTSKSDILAKNPDCKVLEISDFITADDYYDLYHALYYEGQGCGELYQFNEEIEAV